MPSSLEQVTSKVAKIMSRKKCELDQVQINIVGAPSEEPPSTLFAFDSLSLEGGAQKGMPAYLLHWRPSVKHCDADSASLLLTF
jgi:hypothetical protein